MVVIMLASLGTLIELGSLLVIVLYNPSKLPLELVGLAAYTILDPEEFRTPDTQLPTLTLTAVAYERGAGSKLWPSGPRRHTEESEEVPITGF